MRSDTLRDIEVLNNIPVMPDISRIMARLRFHGDTGITEQDVNDILKTVLAVSRPRAIYKVSNITSRSSESVEIDGIKFVSPLLRVNLDKAERVFPYCVTCGEEIDSLRIDTCDESRRYCLDAIKEALLQGVIDYLQNHLIRKYSLDYIWRLNPGDMEAWPASHRKILLSLLRDAVEEIGVGITPEDKLTPAYSQTGLFYYTEIEFESCQLCSKEPCMGRRAYNPELAKKRSLKGGTCGH